VRDFRDVLVSGYSYHRAHRSTDTTSEAWLHTPQLWWGEALGRSTPLSYQDALAALPLVDGVALEMDMVEARGAGRAVRACVYTVPLGPSDTRCHCECSCRLYCRPSSRPFHFPGHLEVDRADRA